MGSLSLPDALAWAARQLDVGPGQPSYEIRTSLLARLAECDFNPPRSWRPAADILLRPGQSASLPTQSMIWLEEETHRRDEVEAFVGGFLKMPPERRQPEFEKLCQQVAFSPELHARLEGLEPLLPITLDCGQYASERCRELAADLGNLLVRPGHERQHEALRISEKWGANGDGQSNVIEELKRVNPDLADLGLAALVRTPAFESWTMSSDTQPVIFGERQANTRTMPAAKPAPWRHDPARFGPLTDARTTPEKGSGWAIAVAIFVGIGLIRLVGAGISSNRDRQNDYPKTITIPTMRYLPSIPTIRSPYNPSQFDLRETRPGMPGDPPAIRDADGLIRELNKFRANPTNGPRGSAVPTPPRRPPP